MGQATRKPGSQARPAPKAPGNQARLAAVPGLDLAALARQVNAIADPNVLKLVRAELRRRNLWKPFDDKPDGTPHPQRLAQESQADILGYGGQAGGGKDLALDTLLPTPYGWTTMAEVQVGDSLLDEQGAPCRVIAKSKIFNKPALRIFFSNGESIVCGPGHQWVTSNNRERERELSNTEEWRAARKLRRPANENPKRADLATRNAANKLAALPRSSIRTAQEISETVTANGGRRINHSVQLAKPLQLQDTELLIDPYTLGAWLGDGTAKGGAIHGEDEGVFAQVANAGYAIRRQSKTISRGILGLQSQLKALGVFGNKHIPPAYLRASFDQRLALAQGLMDTDGCCNSAGQIEFSQIKLSLAEGVRELLASLGIKAPMRIGTARLNGKVICPNYFFKFVTALPMFRLTRKLLKQKRAGFRGTHDKLYIERVEELPATKTQCVQVSSASSMYLCGRAMIPTHNSDLLLGEARNHWRGIIFRRVYPSLTAIIDRSRQIYNPESDSALDDSYNESLHRWRFDTGGILYFGSLQHEKDVLAHQGQPRDYYGFDELTEFSEYQFRFITGWNRTTKKGQRCRIIATMNPPTTEEGRWVIRYFAPWLDDEHPNPAKPGELRWFTTVAGRDMEVPDGRSFVLGEDGKTPDYDYDPTTTPVENVLTPRSRTFIFASVRDNPILLESGYVATLQALPEPLRSILLNGDFKAGMSEDPWRVIPSAWVRAAQARWHATNERMAAAKQTDEGKMDQLGVDVARGGMDRTVLTPRHGHRIPKQTLVNGVTTNDGPKVVQLIINEKPGPRTIVSIDVIGVGSSPVDFSKASFKTMAFNGAEASDRTSKEGNLKFVNKRSAAYWYVRECLDPASGMDMELPDDDPELLQDLTVFRWELTPRGIRVEPKDDGTANAVIKRLGRSPDKGDSCVYSLAPPEAKGMGLYDYMQQLHEEQEARKNGVEPKKVDQSGNAIMAAMQ